MLIEVLHDWVNIDEIIIPEDRYSSTLEEDEKEALFESVKSKGKNLSKTQPILLAESKSSGRLYLVDGRNRVEAYKRAGLSRIFANIEVLENDEEAMEGDCRAAALRFFGDTHAPAGSGAHGLQEGVRGKWSCF